MPPSSRLPPLVILAASLTRIVQRRATLVEGLLVPTMLMIALNLWATSDLPPSSLQGPVVAGSASSTPSSLLPGLLSSLAGAGLSAVFAVTAFRVLLLQRPPPIERWGLLWTRRESRFVGAAIAVTGLSVMPCVLLYSVVMPFLESPDPEQWDALAWGVFAATLLPGAWIFSRLALVLPTVATDRPITLNQAWLASQGNGWRLALIVQGPAVAIGVAMMLLQWQPTTTPGPILSALLVVIHQFSTLLGVSALAIAFHQLSTTKVH